MRLHFCEGCLAVAPKASPSFKTRRRPFKYDLTFIIMYAQLI